MTGGVAESFPDSLGPQDFSEAIQKVLSPPKTPTCPALGGIVRGPDGCFTWDISLELKSPKEAL